MTRELTTAELDVIEAAMDLAQWEDAYNCGLPAQEHIKRAHKTLLDRCSDLASEGDGTWRRPE